MLPEPEESSADVDAAVPEIPTGGDESDANDRRDKLAKTGEPIRRLEAVLFLSQQPLNSRKLSQNAGLEDGTQARTLVKQLNQFYDRVGRSFHVKQIAGGYQLMTRPQFAGWLRRLEYLPKMVRLSPPALETLAVVAYRQPVVKADIEAIRGVSCGEILRQLMERDLVRISGRSEELGRPFLYSTTIQFLKNFGLASLDALPRADHLRGHGLPNWASESQNHSDPTLQSNSTDDSKKESPAVSVSASSPLAGDPTNVDNDETQPTLSESTPLVADDPRSEIEDDEYDEDEYEEYDEEEEGDEDEYEYEDDDVEEDEDEEDDDDFDEDEDSYEYDEDDDDEEGEYEEEEDDEDEWEEVDEEDEDEWESDDDEEWEYGEEEDDDDEEYEEEDDDDEEEEEED